MQQEREKEQVSVGVAMSGGVDSSVTAKLLQNMGYQVQGFFMALAQPDLDQQIERVQKVTSHLDIPLTVIDLSAEFTKQVLKYFTSSYFEGKTPNPCVICNPRIKFGRLQEAILAAGCSKMATGHYARILEQPDRTFHLLKGLDPAKDQSYFLHRLSQQQLSRTFFPLGDQTKKNVYKLADELGIAGVHGSESQDVCFLKNTDVGSFLAQNTSAVSSAGPIITLEGREIGQHSGIHLYTVGQRKGLGIPDATPFYVVNLDPEKNAVVVGKKQDLYRQELTVSDVSWIAGQKPTMPAEFMTRIRYRHAGASALVEPLQQATYRVRFQEPQLAITPGQFAVFYNNDEVMGGGMIL